MSMAAVLTLYGSSSLSRFQSERLARKVSVEAIEGRWVHYVHLTSGAALTADEDGLLRELLDYGEPIPAPPSRSEPLATRHRHVVHTFPRIGTISPWSSQATGICAVCRVSPKIRRIERGIEFTLLSDDAALAPEVLASTELYDRMTESISVGGPPDLDRMFAEYGPQPLNVIHTHGPGVDAGAVLAAANRELGLALDGAMLEYLAEAFGEGGTMGRPPTDVELFMFSVVNSDHCRHLVFNAEWTVDGERKARSLFDMIRNTYRTSPGKDHVLSAYSDNAAVFEGPMAAHWAPNRVGEWIRTAEKVHYLAKVETHNMPTGISAFPGAATGAGGEIRDEGAVGRGSKPKAGLCGFNVSDMLIPGFRQPWELDVGKPFRITSALDIMLEAPIGSARYNNEFGRPCILGYFRTLTTELPLGDNQKEIRGYHKPIMIAGGVGTVRPSLSLKTPGAVKPGDYTIVLGGPAMLIGLGGGAASSITSGENTADLDFASVQRGQAEVQRRCQEVIDACAALGVQSPIKFIHDVGAGGLSNALPELVHDSNLGATFELRDVDSADKSMTPLQIWCCEAQERYVIAVAADGLNEFRKIAERERCGFSIVGKTTASSNGDERLVLMDRNSQDHPRPIDLPMSVLFGKPPRMKKVVDSRFVTQLPFDSSLSSYIPSTLSNEDILQEAIDRVLCLPAVGSKSFLITIGDRTVGGLTARDQMVGPWQTPVADCAVTATALVQGVRTGEAMAMGEKPALALISSAASARMAVAEALLNLSAACISDRLSKVNLSANWMAAANHDGSALYEAVEAVGIDLCPKLGISIPVGKDSMSMATKWKDQETGEDKQVIAPVSLVVTAFAPVTDITRTWTPTLRRLEDVGESLVMLVDLSLGKGRKALGGSSLAQCFKQVGHETPDVHDVQLLKDYFDAAEQLHEAGIVLAYHDVSDGGLFTTLAEMAFAGRCGLEINLDDVSRSSHVADVIEALFSEELAVVFQIRKRDLVEFNRAFATCGPPKGLIKVIGRVPKTAKQELVISHGTKTLYRAGRAFLQQKWASTSYQMQRLRDNPTCADSEYQSLSDWSDPGLSYNLTFQPGKNTMPWYFGLKSSLSNKPKVAILREEGINGAAEMAFGFEASGGFTAVDVHMTDLLSSRVSLAQFQGLAACGGFSYGDTLGAGRGWAQSVLQHPQTRKEFETFFSRPETFTLGVCNGAQFLTRLAALIPGAETWPTFETNLSQQFEARFSMVRITSSAASPSVFLNGMAGSVLPIAVSHGEGYARFRPGQAQRLLEAGQVCLQFVDNRRKVTQEYPFNPNGSPQGITAVTAAKGRVLACMPHPERTVLGGVASYVPEAKVGEWGDFGPWARIFENARRWVG